MTYVHGFDKKEQNRLLRQAEFLEEITYGAVDFSNCKELLEVGCGVGGQSAILLRRFPKLKLTGIDMSEAQIAVCKETLSALPLAAGRFALEQMDAQKMKFGAGIFDGAFLCWVLEHVPSPESVLAEVRRVLKPGGKVFITEVMNSTLYLSPSSEAVKNYWDTLNAVQITGGGDPFVGAKLGNLLSDAGFSQVETFVRPMLWDKRNPDRRRAMISYWHDLMLSAAPQLIAAKRMSADQAELVSREIKSLAESPDAVFMYSFMQASGHLPS